MPALVTPQRRQREDQMDEDEEDSSSDGSSSSSTNKRIRREDHDASPIAPLPPDRYLSRRRTTTNEKPRAPMTHQPGSIVRVKLTDFVTYTDVEFLPGPSLNMVIGPNGTGKSTLVCAICLGLGWGPQHLGRAKEISEFVKHGSQEAMIEIELFADRSRHRRNPVIRCSIKREGNKTSYSINGKPANKKQVTELARSFSIQIDNLCQFLPQDKVVEFAAMSPVDLLRSTQRAVASQDMIDWHDALKELRQEQRTIETTNTSDQATLKSLEDRQRLQEADVLRLREREAVKTRIRLLRIIRPVTVYNSAKAEHQSVKKVHQEAKKGLQQLESDVDPCMRAVTEKKLYRDAVKGVVGDRKTFLELIGTKTNEALEKIKTLQQDVNQLDKHVESEKKTTIENRKEYARFKQIIARLQNQMEQKPDESDLGAINDRIRERMHECRELQSNEDQIFDEQKLLDMSRKEKRAQVESAQSHIKGLESQVGQQNLKLSNINSDTSKAWEHIQKHQHKFEKQVFGPPIVECSVNNLDYVNMVETVVQGGDLTALTVQTKRDFDTLHRMLHEELKLVRLSIRTVTVGLERFAAPTIDEATMKRYGFSGWVLDYLTGPEPVLAMLCESARIHQTGVSPKDTTTDQYNLLVDSSIGSWVTPRSFYRITRRREYGPGATSTQVRGLRQAQVWTDQPVDMTFKREFQENIDAWNEEISACSQKIEELDSRKKRLLTQRNQLETEVREYRTEKEVKTQALATFKALPTRVSQQEEKIANTIASMNEAREKIRALKCEKDKIILDKCRAALEYAKSVEELEKGHSDLRQAEVALIEAISDSDVLDERNITVKRELETKRAEIVRLEKTLTETKKTASRAVKAVNEIKARIDTEPGLNELIESWNHNTTVQDLEEEIEAETAKLELMHGDDSNIIGQYEKRERDIENIKNRLKEIEAGLVDVTGQIERIRAKWEPQLDKLVEQISASFSINMKQINCAGEVGIHKDDDFDQWAIQIRVKFRENEPLTQLDSHRQSGGERAVSTIFYLMSLQSLTRSPFRVVDEINQGMDPRNERLVHARMVAIATGTDELAPALAANADADTGDGTNQAQARGSQYFLITPKLLHDLRYEPGMKVLCIASGEYMDPDQEAVSFKRSLEIRRKLKAAG